MNRYTLNEVEIQLPYFTYESSSIGLFSSYENVTFLEDIHVIDTTKVKNQLCDNDSCTYDDILNYMKNIHIEEEEVIGFCAPSTFEMVTVNLDVTHKSNEKDKLVITPFMTINQKIGGEVKSYQLVSFGNNVVKSAIE